jgi:hypothetical protein
VKYIQIGVGRTPAFQPIFKPTIIDGGNGNDVIVGGAGADVIYGGAGNDEIYGAAGNDLLCDPDYYRNALIGGGGNDKLISGPASVTVMATIYQRLRAVDLLMQSAY